MRRLAGSLVVCTAVVLACSDSELGRRITITNEAGQPVRVFQVRGTDRSVLIELADGESYRIAASLFPDGCLPDPLVARGADDTDLGSTGSQLCSGDLWTIEAP
jgi:hypothetical protein